MTAPYLSVDGLVRAYPGRNGLFGARAAVRAVDGVSFQIMRGETLGLVGESGSGKSTTGRMVLGLEAPDAGRVDIEGQPMPRRSSPEWRRQRARMQMIFQDPLAALNRRLCIAEQIREPLDIHAIGSAADRLSRVEELLISVGLSRDHGVRYPHELSGGQRQRAVLARALATGPDFLVCDEPVSALDVSIQAQVVNLLVDLRERLGLSMLFISHDLRVVRQISDRVAVMYLGAIVETGDANDLFADPRHPYTQALVAASPTPGQGARKRVTLTGDPPDPAARPSGCAFHPRCPVAVELCRAQSPSLAKLNDGRAVACHLAASDASGIAKVA